MQQNGHSLGGIPSCLCPRDMKGLMCDVGWAKRIGNFGIFIYVGTDQLPERPAYTFKKVLLGQARVQTQPPSHHRYPSVEARCDCVPGIRPFIWSLKVWLIYIYVRYLLRFQHCAIHVFRLLSVVLWSIAMAISFFLTAFSPFYDCFGYTGEASNSSNPGLSAYGLSRNITLIPIRCFGTCIRRWPNTNWWLLRLPKTLHKRKTSEQRIPGGVPNESVLLQLRWRYSYIELDRVHYYWRGRAVQIKAWKRAVRRLSTLQGLDGESYFLSVIIAYLDFEECVSHVQCASCWVISGTSAMSSVAFNVNCIDILR